jgi:hypothetical protein
MVDGRCNAWPMHCFGHCCIGHSATADRSLCQHRTKSVNVGQEEERDWVDDFSPRTVCRLSFPILLTEKNCRRQRHVPQVGERRHEQQVGREVDGERGADFL